MLDKNKIKTIEVWSANKWYLFFGVLFVIFFILLEFTAIKEVFISTDKGEAFGILFILQIPALVCLLFTTMIGDYKHRTKFNIYYCKLEKGIDIDYIRKNYCIKDINTRDMLFVDKEDDYNFGTWGLLHDCNSLYKNVN